MGDPRGIQDHKDPQETLETLASVDPLERQEIRERKAPWGSGEKRERRDNGEQMEMLGLLEHQELLVSPVLQVETDL